MDKPTKAHPYNEILPSNKSEITTWMNLKKIMLNKSQTKKKYVLHDPIN